MTQRRRDCTGLLICCILTALACAPVRLLAQPAPVAPAPTAAAATPAMPEPPRLTQVLPKDNLTEQDLAAIQTFVTGWTNILCQSNEALKIAQARRELIEPLRNPVTSPAARDAFAKSLSTAVAQCANAERPLARLNALIVSAELPNATVFDLAAPGLVSDDGAIRYWSAKAVADVAERNQGVFNPDQQKQLLKSLSQAMAGEPSDMTLEQMGRAAGTLTIPEAQAELLKVLEDRVALFLGQPNEGLRMDVKMIGDLQRRLAVADANGQNIEPQLRQLLRITGKYAQAVAKAMQEGRVGPSVQPHAVALMQVADDLFAFGRNELDSAVALGPPLAPEAQAGNNAELMLNVWKWVGTKDVPGVLNQGRINISAADLALPAPRMPKTTSQPQPSSPQPVDSTPPASAAPVSPASAASVPGR